MDKPPWIDEVDEVTEEEALALTALGVEVLFDWTAPTLEEKWLPLAAKVHLSLLKDMDMYVQNKGYIASRHMMFFLRKEL